MFIAIGIIIAIGIYVVLRVFSYNRDAAQEKAIREWNHNISQLSYIVNRQQDRDKQRRYTVKEIASMRKHLELNFPYVDIHQFTEDLITRRVTVEKFMEFQKDNMAINKLKEENEAKPNPTKEERDEFWKTWGNIPPNDWFVCGVDPSNEASPFPVIGIAKHDKTSGETTVDYGSRNKEEEPEKDKALSVLTELIKENRDGFYIIGGPYDPLKRYEISEKHPDSAGHDEIYDHTEKRWLGYHEHESVKQKIREDKNGGLTIHTLGKDGKDNPAYFVPVNKPLHDAYGFPVDPSPSFPSKEEPIPTLLEILESPIVERRTNDDGSYTQVHEKGSITESKGIQDLMRDEKPLGNSSPPFFAFYMPTGLSNHGDETPMEPSPDHIPPVQFFEKPEPIGYLQQMENDQTTYVFDVDKLKQGLPLDSFQGPVPEEECQSNPPIEMHVGDYEKGIPADWLDDSIPVYSPEKDNMIGFRYPDETSHISTPEPHDPNNVYTHKSDLDATIPETPDQNFLEEQGT